MNATRLSADNVCIIYESNWWQVDLNTDNIIPAGPEA